MRPILGQGLGAVGGNALITLIADGDSRTAVNGANAGDTQYPGQINSTLMPGAISTYHDVAVSGETLATMLANVRANVIGNFNVGNTNVSSLWGGVNDQGDNLPNLYQQYWQAVAASGRSTRRVAITEIGWTNSGTWETERQAFNTFIRGTLATMALSTVPIASATATSPVVYTTLAPHGIVGSPVVGVAGNTGGGTNAYGAATVLSPTTFSLAGSVGTVAGIGGSFAVAGGSGVSLVHAIADFGANPQMGLQGSVLNSTLFHADNVHPTLFGELLLAADYAPQALQPWTASKGMALTSCSIATAPHGTPTAFTLTGAGFTGATAVFLGGMAAASSYSSSGVSTWSYTVVNDTTITGSTGVGIFTGTGDVVVIGPNGAVRLAGAFTYT